MNVNEIKKDGFLIKDSFPKSKNMAYLSLTMSLKAFFATYKSMSFRFTHLKNETPDSEDRDYYTMKYVENTCEAIMHLQHFLELYIKSILENEHILLAVDVKRNHELLFDIINKNPFNNAELEKERQLEFKEAFERLDSLITKGKISQQKYGFIKDANKWIEAVNYLRNRIIHRGIFVLRYRSLDYLFGLYVFPFLKKLFETENHVNKYPFLKLNIGENQIDIMNEIIKHFKSEEYSITKVALLKELGRASFENPIKSKLFTGKHEKQRAELIAKEISVLEDVGKVLICPVCKCESLVMYHDYVDTYNPETGEDAGSFQMVYNVTCNCCSLELFSDLGDIPIMNLQLPNYWETE